jgi:hypothetical protein
MFVSGCGAKKADGTSTANPPADASPAPPPAAPAPTAVMATPAPIPAAPGGGADLKVLNHAYVRWVVQNRRRATSFEDFVTSSGVSVPAPPAGKKYVIDKAGFIALVDQ